MNINLANKHALVTGASQGIGAAIALSLAELGASVTLVSRSEEKLERIIKQLPGSNHYGIAVDMDQSDVLKIKLEKRNAELPFDIVINNSGGPAPGKIVDAKYEAFEQAFDRHLKNAIMIAELVLPHMRTQQFGRFVNVLSSSVKIPLPNLGVSNTMRWAMAAWAKTLAGEVAADGITVNCVLPGKIDTPRLHGVINAWAEKQHKTNTEMTAEIAAAIPAGRFGTPKEFADVVAFLCSPAAAYVNGVALPIDGGNTGCF